MEQTAAPPSVTFETDPTQYKHWKLSIEGNVATLAMDVREDAGMRPNDYKLKLKLTLIRKAHAGTENV